MGMEKSTLIYKLYTNSVYNLLHEILNNTQDWKYIAPTFACSCLLSLDCYATNNSVLQVHTRGSIYRMRSKLQNQQGT